MEDLCLVDMACGVCALRAVLPYCNASIVLRFLSRMEIEALLGVKGVLLYNKPISVFVVNSRLTNKWIPRSLVNSRQ